MRSVPLPGGLSKLIVDSLKHVHVVEDLISIHLSVNEAILCQFCLLVDLCTEELCSVMIVLLYLFINLFLMNEHVFSIFCPYMCLFLVSLVLLNLTLLLLFHLYE